MLTQLAYLKTTTLDDAVPATNDAPHIGVPQRFDEQQDKPTASIGAFVRFTDAADADVPGGSCNVRLFLRVYVRDTQVAFWMDCGERTVTGKQKLAMWSFPGLNANSAARFVVTNNSGTHTVVKVYASAGGDVLGAYDPTTGLLRVADMLVHGGEQNALGVHRAILAAIASPDGAVAWDDSAALEASSVTKAAAGNLYGFVAHNTNAAKRYLQFYDATSVPADGAVPKLVYELPAAGSTRVDLVPGERRHFPTGICWALSTTLATKTIGLAECFANVAYG